MAITAKPITRIGIFTAIYIVINALFPMQQSVLTMAYILGVATTGIIYAVLLYYLFSFLDLDQKSQVIVIWAPLFVIQFFNPILEGYLFTTSINGVDQLLGAFIFGAILSLLYAIAGTYLFSVKGQKTIGEATRETLVNRSASNLVARVLLASLSWPVIYFIFGAIVGPYVLPYYTDPSSGYNLILPDVVTLLLVQTFRGFVYVSSLLPLVFSLKLDFRKLSIILVTFLYTGGGLAIFVIVETFPVFLRIVHGIELFADSLFFGFLISYLIGRKDEKIGLEHESILAFN